VKVNQIAGLRIRFIIPHKVLAVISNGKMHTWGLEKKGNIYIYDNTPVLEAVKKQPRDGTIVVELKALIDLWIQEPGLTSQVMGNGAWRGFGRKGKWVKTRNGVDGWLPVKNKDARYVTVHFWRTPTHPDYITGIEFREGARRVRFRSDGGFEKLFADPARMGNEWTGCKIMGGRSILQGTVDAPEFSSKLVWELAGHPAADGGDWMHFLGWPGGAGVVVQNKAPWYAHEYFKGMPVDRLWGPELFRLLRKGKSIKQRVDVQWPSPLKPPLKR